jgi:hypothetical protein
MQEIDNLRQSILTKAFGDEFVPQDPSAEPASRLEGLRSSGKSVCGSLEVKGGGPGAPRTKDLGFVSSKYDNELEKAHGNNL